MRTSLVSIAALVLSACDVASPAHDSAVDDGALVRDADREAGLDGGAVADGSAAPDGTAADATPARDDAGADASEPSETCVDSASLTAVERMLLRMPANQWTSLPNTAFDPWCRSHGLVEPGQGDAYRCHNVITAWGGGAYDPDQHAMVLFGGGHNDYAGNEVYAFDIARAAWRVVKAPTPYSQVVPSRDEYLDGTPVSRHTYDGFAYIRDLHQLFVWGGARFQDGGSTAASWLFDARTQRWTRRASYNGPGGSGLYWMGTDYDRATRTVFTRTDAGIFAYSVASDEWRRLADFGYPPYYPAHQSSRYRRGIVLGSRRLFYTLGGAINGGTAPDVIVWDIERNRDVTSEWPMRGEFSAVASGGLGADYDSAADAIVTWAGGAPAILSLRDNLWRAGSSVGAPPMQVAAGTYGRFRYVPRLNVFVLVNVATENVHFYKHTAGCG